MWIVHNFVCTGCRSARELSEKALLKTRTVNKHICLLAIRFDQLSVVYIGLVSDGKASQRFARTSGLCMIDRFRHFTCERKRACSSMNKAVLSFRHAWSQKTLLELRRNRLSHIRFRMLKLWSKFTFKARGLGRIFSAWLVAFLKNGSKPANNSGKSRLSIASRSSEQSASSTGYVTSADQAWRSVWLRTIHEVSTTLLPCAIQNNRGSSEFASHIRKLFSRSFHRYLRYREGSLSTYRGRNNRRQSDDQYIDLCEYEMLPDFRHLSTNIVREFRARIAAAQELVEEARRSSITASETRSSSSRSSSRRSKDFTNEHKVNSTSNSSDETSVTDTSVDHSVLSGMSGSRISVRTNDCIVCPVELLGHNGINSDDDRDAPPDELAASRKAKTASRARTEKVTRPFMGSAAARGLKSRLVSKIFGISDPLTESRRRQPSYLEESTDDDSSHDSQDLDDLNIRVSMLHVRHFHAGDLLMGLFVTGLHSHVQHEELPSDMAAANQFQYQKAGSELCLCRSGYAAGTGSLHF
jgi:hypothetical protein